MSLHNDTCIKRHHLFILKEPEEAEITGHMAVMTNDPKPVKDS